MNLSYYEILGVPHSATIEEIKAAYRKQAFKWHPDHNNNSRESNEHFKLIGLAYEILSTPTKRRQYDQSFNGSDTEYKEEAFGAHQAAEVFMQEMLELANELSFKNTNWREIAKRLEEKGCPSQVAPIIAREVERKRKSTIRSEAKKVFWQGIGLLILGIGVSFLTYSWAIQNGGVYFVAWGLFISAAISIFRGAYFYITGEVPIPKNITPPRKKENKKFQLIGYLIVISLFTGFAIWIISLSHSS